MLMRVPNSTFDLLTWNVPSREATHYQRRVTMRTVCASATLFVIGLFVASLGLTSQAEAGWYQTYYQKGYDKGLKDGYQDGYTDQYRASYDDAFREALYRYNAPGSKGPTPAQLAKAWKAGYKDGYKDGYKKGVKMGKIHGEDDAHRDVDDFKGALRDQLRDELRRRHGLD